MNKRILSLVLALVMVLGTFGTVFAASYDDVTGTDVATAVDRLSTLGILEGYPDGTFKPANSITRAEFAAVAARAKGLEAVAQAAKGLATGFNDVPATHWASGYVGTAAKLGIVNGMGFGQFVPEAPVKYEEAVTMIVRALGYEAAAQAKGGYPYGYLIVANEVGLLDAVKGTQGVAATRGMVAQLTDNALEVKMMVQVGFGTDTKWVVSGTEDTDVKYLLDELGFDSVIGRAEVSSNKKKITVSIEDKDEAARVGKNSVVIDEVKGVDLYAVNGLETKFWYKGEVVIYVVQEEAKFDAVAYDEKDEVTLVTEDENYEVIARAALTVDGDKVAVEDFDADYAKIVLNSDDEIIWAEGYTLADFIVVEEVKDNEILGYGDDELKVKDFTIVKEGKTIAAEALEDGDIVLYNNAEEFAVVTTMSKTAKIDRVYTDGFRLDGTTYKFATIKYFDGENLNDIDADLLEEIMDDEDEVELFFNFADKAVLLAGADKDVDSSSFYAVLLNNAAVTTGRRGVKELSIDVRAQDGTKKLYDLDFDVLNDSKLLKAGKTVFTDLTDLKADANITSTGHVIKITVDEDGDVTKVAIPENDGIKSDFKVTATYGKGNLGDYKLSSNTVVFYNSNKKAIKIGDIKDEFEEVKKDGVIFYEAGKAVAIVADTNADADTIAVVGLLNRIQTLKDGSVELRIRVKGTNETYVADNSKSTLPAGITTNMIVKIEVGEKSGKIADGATTNVLDVTIPTIATGTIKSVNGRIITTTATNEYSLIDGYKIYDANDEYAEIKTAKDLVDREVTLYLDGGSKYYVTYVIAGDIIDLPGETGTVTYIDGTTAKSSVELKGTTAKTLAVKYNNESTNDIIVDQNKLVIRLVGSDGTVQTHVVNTTAEDVLPGKLNKLIGNVVITPQAGAVTSGTVAIGAFVAQAGETYKLTVSINGVTQEDELAVKVLDDNATLKTLTILGKDVTMTNTNNAAEAITISLPFAGTDLTELVKANVNAVTQFGNTAVVAVTAATSDAVGTDATVVVTVTAEDGIATKVYTVTVEKAAASDEMGVLYYTIDGNNYASTNQSVTTAGAVTETVALIGATDFPTAITVKLADETATLTLLTETSTPGEWTFTVTAEDGKVATYTLTLTK